MTRPSRLERWSATTTRQTGSLRPPTRVNLSRTATMSLRSVESRLRRLADCPGRAWSALLADQRPDVGHPATATDLAHDGAHLGELLDELVDGLHARSGAARDAQPARALDQLGPPPFERRHRQDDRLDPIDLAF